MAQQMSLSSRPFTASAFAPRAFSTRRCVAVRAGSREQQVPIMDRVAPSMLAALMTLSTGFATFDASFAPPARADEEELSPYQKRQAELERRRELLREAREKAAARAAGETYTAPEPAAAPAAPEAPKAPSLSSNSLQSYNAATQNRPSVPAPAPEPEAPKWGGFSFSKPAEPETPAPAPAAAEPAKKESSSDLFSSDMWNTPIKPKAAAPAPAPPAPVAPVTPAPFTFTPAPVKAPEPVKPKVEAKKVEPKKAEAVKPGKRRGPLPLWFAEILVLGAYAGVFLAVTKYSKQSGEVLKAVWAKVVEAYSALEKLVNKPKAA